MARQFIKRFAVKVAAKTGTAQIQKYENQCFFTGYLPAENPQIAI